MRSFSSLFFLACFSALGQQPSIQLSGSLILAGSITVGPSTIAPVFSENCTDPASTACVNWAAITANDPDTSGGWSGKADPTIRQDPTTTCPGASCTLYLAYSYLYVTTSGSNPPCPSGIQAVNTHLQRSTDGGSTWTLLSPLFTGACVSDPITPSQNDMTSAEVNNLMIQNVGGSPSYYLIRQTYNLTGAGHNQVTGSIAWDFRNCTGASPACLASATKATVLGTPQTNATGWPYSVNMSTLASQVSGCVAYFEPWLNPSGTTVELGLNCQNNSGALPFYAAFTTPNPQSISNWVSTPPTWTYVGGGAGSSFATTTDAKGVCHYMGQPSVCASQTVFITQMDVVPCSDASSGWCSVFSLVTLTSGKVSLGCLAGEMATVNPPAFVYDAGGRVQIDAVLTSSDSTVDGPGSCTYSLYDSSAGMILAHRKNGAVPFTFLMESGLNF
jgi:hypothetical protein